MSDQAPQHEITDIEGSTTHFNGSVGTSSTAIPSVAGNKITELIIHCPQTNSASKELFVSFDGGTTFFTLYRGTSFSWTPKGSPTQIHIKGNINTVDYEIIINRSV